MSSITVAKHRYFKGKSGKGVKKYVDYVTHREGHDREEGGRRFFDRKDSSLDGRNLKKAIDRQDTRWGPIAHELILSPGVNAVDSEKYTRNLMKKLESSKGMEVEWTAVSHKNTDHHHIHVFIMGKTQNGSPVRINRQDHQDLREWGDRYIDREHHMERFLERDIDKIFKERGRGDLRFEPDRGDELYNGLLFGRKDEGKKKKRPEKKWDKERAIAELPDKEKIYSKDAALSKFSSLEELQAFEEKLKSKSVERVSKEDYAQLRKWIYEKERHSDDYHETREIEKFERKYSRHSKEPDKNFGQLDSSIKKGLAEREAPGLRSYKPRSQRRFERRGRESAWHSEYQSSMEKMRLQQELKLNPENREYIESQLEWLKESDRHTMPEFERIDIDELLGWTDKDRKRDNRETKKGQEEKERTSREEREPEKTEEEIKLEDKNNSPQPEEDQESSLEAFIGEDKTIGRDEDDDRNNLWQ